MNTLCHPGPTLMTKTLTNEITGHQITGNTKSNYILGYGTPKIIYLGITIPQQHHEYRKYVPGDYKNYSYQRNTRPETSNKQESVTHQNKEHLHQQ